MNPNLPKPMLDAVTRQTLPTNHPSADLLTAFAENALAGSEYRRIADHLAQCGECRDVVFVSVAAADKPLRSDEHVATERGSGRRRMLVLAWGMSISVAVLFGVGAWRLWQNKHVPLPMQVASRSVSAPAQPAQEAHESQ